jgi:hypothetical protein
MAIDIQSITGLTSVEILMLKAAIELFIKLGIDISKIIKDAKIEDKDVWMAEIDAAYERLRVPTEV